MSVYKRVFAWLYHAFLSDRGMLNPYDSLVCDVRAPLLAQATGNVLEIGAGNGSNLPLYPSDVRLTLLDPNPHMLTYLHGTATRLGINHYTTVEAFAENLPFPGAHFDTIVSTHVLCSVRDQAQALSEIRRVLRSGGRFLFLEHVSAPPQTPIYHLQRLINPAWKTIGDGCHLTRDTGAAIRAAGFRAVELNLYQAGFPPFVSPHVFGTAQA